jgi:predicted DNA-binding transcriptional regulator AlpA
MSELREGLWDVRDVSAFLKVSRSWVYQRTASGLLPHFHIGGLLRFVPEEIRAFARGESRPTNVVALVRK